MGYLGAVITCVITASIAPTVNTISCAQDGYPAAWTRTASGSCISPVDLATQIPSSGATVPTLGSYCLVGAAPGSYQYVAGTLSCVVTATSPLVTSPLETSPLVTAPIVIAPTLGSYCLVGAAPGSYQSVGGTLTCVATLVVTTTTNAPSTTVTTVAAGPAGGCLAVAPFLWPNGTCHATAYGGG